MYGSYHTHYNLFATPYYSHKIQQKIIIYLTEYNWHSSEGNINKPTVNDLTCIMPISIVLRSYGTSEIRGLVSYLEQNNEIENEIVAVCRLNDYEIGGINLILEDSNRFEARITGIKNARFDRVLFLDSDQLLEDGLLGELDNMNKDMVIIPEKSSSRGLTARCLDDWRMRNESLARRKTSPFVPVIPRFYRRETLLKAINALPDSAYKIVSHEDSVIYYEAFKITQTIGFSSRHILNRDPNFFKLMYKAYQYGRSSKSTKALSLPGEIEHLLHRLDSNTLDVRELGFGEGFLIQIPRGIAYEIGKLL